MVYDEQTRDLADEVRGEHTPDGTGSCPRCRVPGCAAYRLAMRIRAPRAQAGPNVAVIEAANRNGPTLSGIPASNVDGDTP